MLSVILGFAGAFIYGASDFFGGLGAKRISAIAVTAINSVVGAVLLGLACLALPTSWSSSVWLWGTLSGLAGAASLSLLYACLAIGPMSILAPIMALVSAIVPIVAGFLAGERLSQAGYLGLIVGLIAVVLICAVPGSKVVRPTARGIALAVGAGLAVGVYLIMIDKTPTDSGPAPLVLTFVVAGVVMGLILVVMRVRRGGPGPRPDRLALVYSGLSGLTDAAAALLLLLALRSGELTVVSVLSALSPAGTIVLAAVVLRERIAAVQWLGLALALAAAVLLALA